MEGRARTGAGSEPKGRVQKTRNCGAGTLNMEAAGFSEMLVLLYRTTCQRKQQNNNYHIDIVFKKHESEENSFFMIWRSQISATVQCQLFVLNELPRFFVQCQLFVLNELPRFFKHSVCERVCVCVCVSVGVCESVGVGVCM